jgi:hypothetical protein
MTASSSTPSASMAVSRPNSGGGPDTDASGTFWNGDYGILGGKHRADFRQYQRNDSTHTLTCSWGSFQYTIAVPNGNYTVNLKFAAIYSTTADN